MTLDASIIGTYTIFAIPRICIHIYNLLVIPIKLIQHCSITAAGIVIDKPFLDHEWDESLRILNVNASRMEYYPF